MRYVVIAGWFGKVIVIALSFFNVQLMMRLVGVDGVASQAILMSLGSWVTLLNFGLPSAVQNLISRYQVEKKSVFDVKQTALCVMIIQSLALLPGVIIIGLLARHYLLSDDKAISTFAIIIFVLGCFLSSQCVLFNQIQFAEHRGFWPNIYPALGAIIVTALLILMQLQSSSSINILLCVFALSNIIISVISFCHADLKRVWCLDRQVVKTLWIECRGFSLFAVMSACVLSADYFVMSRLLTAYEISEYNILQRIFAAVLSIYAIALSSSWSRVSELMYAKNFNKIKEVLSRLIAFGVAINILAGAFVINFGDEVIALISNGEIHTPSKLLISTFIVYGFVRVWSDAFAMVLLSNSKVSAMNVYIPIQALVSILMQTLLVKSYGSSGVVLGMTMSFVLTSVWILPYYFTKLNKH